MTFLKEQNIMRSDVNIAVVIHEFQRVKSQERRCATRVIFWWWILQWSFNCFERNERLNLLSYFKPCIFISACFSGVYLIHFGKFLPGTRILSPKKLPTYYPLKKKCEQPWRITGAVFNWGQYWFGNNLA